MPETQITVRGEFVAHRPPERATVRARVGIEGPKAASVLASATESFDALTSAIKSLHHPEHGPVTWWSADRIRTWAHRPWNKDGKQLPPVHHAAVGLQVKFKDFEALGRWFADAVDVTGVTIDHLEWTLTAAHRLSLVREVRTAAVRQAKEKAQEYADALDLGPVRVLAIADAGMLGSGLVPNGGGGPVAYARAAAGATAQGRDLALVPEDVSVSSVVDARFATG